MIHKELKMTGKREASKCSISTYFSEMLHFVQPDKVCIEACFRS
jgi:hypothetical protein